ncbi:uncharacterized protein LOC124358253 [Homalodisca vitripennis]|uniref:uncharacterized protein LOC124358253 n=1 Tax=Homalodisca vitripennis TaxID=197043 RepID=UPI001EEB7479|nr:uncharacterized protein LOC124358253 [Homalodisca vitripennis]
MAAVRHRMIGVLSKLSTYSSTYVGFSTLTRRREAVYSVCHKCTVLAETCSSVRPEVGGKRHLLSNNGGGMSLVNKVSTVFPAYSLAYRVSSSNYSRGHERIVCDAEKLAMRMNHRGACACNNDTGYGAEMLNKFNRR